MTRMLALLVLVCLAGCSQQRYPEVLPVAAEEISPEHAVNLKTDGHYFLSGVLTQDGLGDLRARGVETVIDLRQPEQIPDGYQAEVESLGFVYHNAPLRSDGLGADEAALALEFVQTARDWPVLLQCGSGNRVGALYALHVSKRDKLTVEEALQLADEAGIRNRQLRADLATLLEAEASSND